MFAVVTENLADQPGVTVEPTVLFPTYVSEGGVNARSLETVRLLKLKDLLPRQRENGPYRK